LPVDILGSRYIFNANGEGSFTGYTYEFGIDPAWYETTNKLSFYNSLKMKMAIIFGVSHMMIGLACGFLNRLFKKQYAFIFMENIPEFLMLGNNYILR
jgi:V-type H+-transporting ATPase subunit a